MADARNAISSRDSHIWTLRVSVLLLAALLAFREYVTLQRQNQFSLHVPPDLSKGALLKPGELQAPNSYAFAHFVWRGLNDWPEDGRKDYRSNIDNAECLVTPSFKQWLDENYAQKNRSGELDRTRAVTAALEYTPEFVTPLGNNTFSTALVMRIREYVAGSVTPVKDITLKYSLRVVPDQRACNPMGMAIAGFADTTSRRVAEENKS